MEINGEISTQNGNSGKINIEANTNPLYEFNNSQNIMASEPSNPLYDMDSEPQKELKSSDSSNPLYDFLQSENTNGHSEEVLINGGGNDVDLLDNSNAGTGDIVEENTGDLIGNTGGENSVDLLGDSADLPVTSDDSGVTMDINNLSETQAGEETQERSRTNSEASETDEQEEVQKTEQPNEESAETKNTEPEENGVKVNGTSDVNENGMTEEEAVRDPNIIRETREKEEVHFAEMSNVRQKFESGVVSENEPTPRKISVRDEYDQAGGEYESTPVENPDVVRETDAKGEDLPEVGTAKSLVSKFKSISEENTQPVASSKRVSPPRDVGKVEYESQPTEHLEQYEGKSEEGVFESSPAVQEDMVRSGDLLDDVKPEEGSTKNILNKFKEKQSEPTTVRSQEKRELTPDRSGKVEYVSEPTGQSIVHEEAKSDAGVFENTPKEEEDVVRSGDRAEEVLPELGTTKNILSKFKQYESEFENRPPPSPKREITPDRSGKVEYVSEPRGFLEKYEQREDAGVFESQPVIPEEVVRSEDVSEDVKPEAGSAKKAMEMFKEIQKQSSSPVHKSGKEFTPPRETSPGKTVAGVVENNPEQRPDVVRSGDTLEDTVPEQGSARNILNKFKEIQSGSGSNSPSKQQKEFTPPPEAGVYENTPSEHLVVETRQSESGVLESTPAKSMADVARERDSVTPESEIPESGMAKNLVSKFRQLETSAKASKSPSPRFKEFTPPRESRGPLSPKSPAGATNGVHPSELPGQYQQQDKPGVFENQPEVNEGVVREADTDWSEGMPKANTTMSMLEKFKSMQQKAQEEQATPPPVSRKPKNIQHE